MVGADLLAQTRAESVKNIASELGFFDCKIAEAKQLDREAQQLENWLKKDFHGEMQYMENHFDLRINPTLLVPGAKSVIVLSQNYYPEKELPESGYKISKYAYGRDYHKVIKKKLKTLLQRIEKEVGQIYGRGFVDSAPVLEKAWAQHSGIGWMGKHTNIISKSEGSFFFLAVLIVDMPLASDHPVIDHCGTCTACIDACPTDAIVNPYMVDGSKCISYFTIELKNSIIPTEVQGKFGDWIFGCDICQDVCPWNRFSKATNEQDFSPNKELEMNKSQWENLEVEVFDQVFKGSPVKRTGYSGLMRNIHFVKNSQA